MVCPSCCARAGDDKASRDKTTSAPKNLRANSSAPRRREWFMTYLPCGNESSFGASLITCERVASC